MLLKLSKILFFILFIFSPLAFGTTEPWSYAIMESAAGLALFFLLFSIVRKNEALYQVPGLLPAGLFLAYILFQLIPLPPAFIELISSNTYLIHQTNQDIINTRSWMTLSVHPLATLSEFCRYTTYVIFYVLTVQLLSRKNTFQATALTIVVFGGLLAFSSILQFYLTEDMALWFRHSPRNSIVVGPYVNHNHYAGLMEMIFPITLGLFLFYRPRIGSRSLLKGIAEIFSQEKANIHILIGAAALMVVISIFVSLSRGAMISICLAMVVFTWFLLNRKISKGNTTIVIVIAMIGMLAIGWFGWDQIFERFSRLKNAEGVIYEYRLDFWKDTKEVIKHYPLTGSGIGTFSDIYPLHRTLISERFLTHAHNDYLELLAEGGLIGFAAAAAFLLTIFIKTYRIFLRRRDAFSIYLYMGSITAMASILFHSMTDFNLHIGANGLWFFFCAGIAVSAAHTGIKRKSLPSRLPKIESNRKKWSFTLISLSLAVFLIFFNVSSLAGRFYYKNIKDFTVSRQAGQNVLTKYKNIASLAVKSHPFHSEYQFAKANAELFLSGFQKADPVYIRCLELDPLNSRHLNQYGKLLARQGKTEQAHKALHASLKYDQSSAEYNFEYAAWLLSQNKKEEALPYMKQAMILDGQIFSRALTRMIFSGIDKETIFQAVPQTPGASIAYAEYLVKTGSILDGVDKYMATLELIENQSFKHSDSIEWQNNIKDRQYMRIYRALRELNDISDAMVVLETAEAKMPMNAKIKVTLGDLYYSQGIIYKAQDKYDHALLLDPNNIQALKMLNKINR